MTAPTQVFEVTVTKWVDAEGFEKQEIGRLLIRGAPDGVTFADFTYQIDENAHPLVPSPLRKRGTLGQQPLRQSVWALVRQVADMALAARPH